MDAYVSPAILTFHLVLRGGWEMVTVRNTGVTFTESADRIAESAMAIIDTLMPRLQQQFPVLTEDQIRDAGIDAILDHLIDWQSGQGYPEHRSLYRDTWRNCADMVDADFRRKAREHAWCEANYHNSVDIRTTWLHRNLPQLLNEIANLMHDDAMRATFTCWFAGERSTRVYANALGLGDLAAELQQDEVQRHKDRLRKFLRRSDAAKRALRQFMTCMP